MKTHLRFLAVIAMLFLLTAVAFAQGASPQAHTADIQEAKAWIESNLLRANQNIKNGRAEVSKQAFYVIALPNLEVIGGAGDTWAKFLMELSRDEKIGLAMARFSEYAVQKKWLEVTDFKTGFRCKLSPTGRQLIKSDSSWTLDAKEMTYTRKVYIESHVKKYGEIKIKGEVMSVEAYVVFDLEEPYKAFSFKITDLIAKKFEQDFANHPIVYTFVKKNGRWVPKIIM